MFDVIAGGASSHSTKAIVEWMNEAGFAAEWMSKRIGPVVGARRCS